MVKFHLSQHRRLSLAFRDTLLRTVGVPGLVTDQMVLFFICDFFWGLGMLKGLK